MALKRRTKVESGFSSASMSDLVFLLLIFFMITSTLISPNAIKLLLPKSNSQTSAKPLTTVSITKDGQYFIESDKVSFEQIEPLLVQKLGLQPETYISLHVDEDVPMKDVVAIMNICKDHNYKLILATRAQ